jgi:hypothetical protein
MLGIRSVTLSCVGALALMAAVVAADLKEGSPDIKSAGSLSFAPDGVLLIGDSTGGAIFAVDTGDKTAGSGAGPKVEGIDQKVAALLGTDAKQVLINDVAVNPVSGNIYLSVSRGKGPDAAAAIVRVDRAGKLSEVSLKSVKFAKAALPNAPTGKGRADAITDIQYVDGRVFVAGLSNEEFASRLRAIPYPFAEADKGTGVEIFHGAHGKFETASPVRTFAAYKIAGETNLLAAYTCTPLVRFPVSQLKPGVHVKGTTIAELGNRNRPLDMIVYSKSGKDFLLIANSSRGMMKVPLDAAEGQAGITQPVRGGTGTAGLNYETITAMKGVQQLDKFDANSAVILVRTDAGQLNLETVPLP